LEQTQRNLPANEKLIEVALKAVHKGDLKSVTTLLGWIDRRKLNRAVRRVRGGKKHPKLEGYIERVLLNSVKIKWAANGRRSITMMRSRNVVSLVLRYYFKGAAASSAEAMVFSMVKRIRHNIQVRLRRKDDAELHRIFSGSK
jgi:hypothetical protein